MKINKIKMIYKRIKNKHITLIVLRISFLQKRVKHFQILNVYRKGSLTFITF